MRQIDLDLQAWFAEARRHLSFRQTKDPYAVMVSEFMLQQTTVAVVEGYFPRFMGRYPTVHDLAAAAEEDVLGQWAGLGYYRRARQLHAAARVIVADFAGVIPSDPAKLVRLPGIGRYTAGAIASTSYDVAAPILEANTIRVFSRLAGIDGIIGDHGFTNQLWQIAAALVSEARSPGAFNIAAMELGSLVCRPEPRCEICPVSEHCTAFRTGTASKIPRPAPKPQKVDVQMLGFVLTNARSEYLVRHIQKGSWHAGMHEFPTLRFEGGPVPPPEPFTSPSAAADLAQLHIGLAPANLHYFRHLRYTVTHHRVRLDVFRGQLLASPPSALPENCQFLPLTNISSLPMGSAQKKILTALIETDLNSS
jgi:A/G-specific adenine glycosylase